MWETLFLLIGLAGGLAAGWLAASWRARLRAGDGLAGAQQQAAVAQAAAAEARAQLERAAGELAALRDQLAEQGQARVRAETQLVESQQNLLEQRQLLDTARQRLVEAFAAASGEALKSNNQAFLVLAGQAMDTVLAQAKGDLGQRQAAIDGLVKPLAESLKRYEEHVKALEESRQQAYGSLSEQLKSATVAQQELQRQTANLVTALRRPDVRGRWGEVTLRNVVELAGMSCHCDFTEQANLPGTDGRLRPDMIVHLPAQRQIVVDSKVSLEAYLSGIAAAGDEERGKFLDSHARQLRTHMGKLAEKSYWSELDRAPEFVIMFVPGEAFLSCALERDKTLLEDSMRRNVILATPTTLIAVLRATAFDWGQQQIAQSARQVSDLGKSLHERLRVLCGHIISLGRSLGKANESYNKAVASMETRVMPAVRKFEELNAFDGEAAEDPQQVEITPRMLVADAEHDDPPASSPQAN